MINTRESLMKLYGELESAASALDDADRVLLANAALFLSEDGHLCCPASMCYGDEAARELLGHHWSFVDARVQEGFPKMCAALIDECNASSMARWLAEEETGELPLSLSAPPTFLGDAPDAGDRLARLLDYIGRDLAQVDRVVLRSLPIIRTADDRLVRGTDPVCLCPNDRDRLIARAVGLAVVHPGWGRNPEIALVYRAAGVDDLQARHLIAALRDAMRPWTELPRSDIVAHLKELYDFFARHEDELAEKVKESLRRLPIYLTQSGIRRAAEGSDGPIFLTHLAPNDPILEHLDALQRHYLVHGDLVGHRFLQDVAGLPTLGPIALIGDVMLPSYQRLDDMTRRAVLAYVRDHLASLAEPQLTALREQAIILCDDGRYRRGCEVYFASPALDGTFTHGYRTLHPQYGVPAATPEDGDDARYRRNGWYTLFRVSGVKERPGVADLVTAVERIAASGPPTQKAIDALRPLYEELSRRVGGRMLLDDAEELKRLRDLAWLPAGNKGDCWHRPNKVYQAQYARLVGAQAPVLSFVERRELREYLDMPVEPPAAVVAAHLLAMTRQRENLKPEDSRHIFQYLGQRWAALDEGLRLQLRQEPIVHHAGTYWLARHVFLTDGDELRRLFGERRCYVASLPDDARSFLAHLGAHEQPRAWVDSIELLQEIAREHRDGAVVEDGDITLIWRALDYLGKQHRADDQEVESGLNRLRRLAIVPDRDGRLHPPDRIVRVDEAGLRCQFDGGAFPEIDPACVSADVHVLLDQLGTPWLHAIVKRHVVAMEPAEDDGDAERLTLRLHKLVPAFQRIGLKVRTHTGSGELNELKRQIQGLQVVACRRLQVSCVLDNDRGWRVEGYTSDAKTLYDSATKKVYVVCDAGGEVREVAVARELDQAHFPEHAQAATIASLLGMRHAVNVARHLDELGYPPLATTDAKEHNSTAGSKNVIAWNGDGTPSAPEPESELESEPTSEPQIAPDVGVDTQSTTEGTGAMVGVAATERGPVEPPSAGQETASTHVVKANHVDIGDDEGSALATARTLARQHPVARSSAIPPFRDTPAPRSPALANRYDELAMRYGFDPDAIQTTAQAGDVAWQPDTSGTGGEEHGPLYQTRFTLG
jgi:hypothetical protein